MNINEHEYNLKQKILEWNDKKKVVSITFNFDKESGELLDSNFIFLDAPFDVARNEGKLNINSLPIHIKKILKTTMNYIVNTLEKTLKEENL